MKERLILINSHIYLFSIPTVGYEREVDRYRRGDD